MIAANAQHVSGKPWAATAQIALPQGLATDNLFSPNFGQPIVFMDPRRAMVGVGLNLGR